MTIVDAPMKVLVPASSALRTKVLSLITESLSDPLGLLAPSIYDTARVALLPAGMQPDGCLNYLLCEQDAEGSWGGPGVYAVVPTLAATSTMLQLYSRWEHGKDDSLAPQMERISTAGLRGLNYLQRVLPCMLPDTIAVEYIVPMLLEEIEQTRCGIKNELFSRQSLPIDPQELSQLYRLRKAVQYAPRQLIYSLEVLGKDILSWGSIEELSRGVGTSPAATAALLTHGELTEQQQSNAIAYLFTLTRRLNGALPNAAPIDLFDRAWSCYAASLAGVPLESIAPMVIAGLLPQLGERGSSYGTGGPVESDDSSVNLLALYATGTSISPECLLGYEMDDHFACFPNERNPSMSCNAHILEAMMTYLASEPFEYKRYYPKCEKIAGYLIDHQYPAGYWQDKWHSSPYYATFCCVNALHRLGEPPVLPAITHGLGWLLQTQRDEGGWGNWQATAEETAYAVLSLCAAGLKDRTTSEAIRRGLAFLQLHQDDPVVPLWHGKELYAPQRVVHVMVLSAMYVALCCLESEQSTVPRVPTTGRST